MRQSDYLAWCRQETERSRRWRSTAGEQSLDSDWKRYIDLYAGKVYDVISAADRLTVNLIFATINVMGPAVAINNPRFVVNPRSLQNAPQAVVAEEVLNYLWRTHKYQNEFRLSIHDWMIVGHGWLKVGYKSVKPPKDEKAPEADSGPATPDNVGNDYGVDDREDVEGNVESELNVDDDRPFVERISPFDMYVDPDARHPKEMRWIAQRTWRPLVDVHVDKRYSETNRKKVQGSSWSRWNREDGDGRSGSDLANVSVSKKPPKGDVVYAQIIEFYDIKRNKVSTFALETDGSDASPDKAVSNFLIKPAEMPYATGHPFVMLRNYEVPDNFYTMGDVAQIESLQLELNETRNQMLNFRKKYKRGFMYAKDRIDREGVQALESDIDNVLVPVMGDDQPQTAVAPLPVSITPPEFFDQSAMISTDLDRVSGVSDYQRGAQTAVKRTATEAAMIQDAANARAQDRLAKVEDILARVGERVIALMQQYMTGDQVAMITSVPAQAWIKYNKKWIQGKFDFEVRGGSTEPRNETFRRQGAMQLVDASMPFLEMGVADPLALYRKILQDGFGEKDPQKYINPQAQGEAPPDTANPWDQMPPGGQAPPPPMPPPAEVMPEQLVAAQPPPTEVDLTQESVDADLLQAMLMGLPPQG